MFHHADHIHPFRDNIVGPSGSVTIPRSADNIDTTYYRITLTVTDSSGLSTTQSVDVKPRLVTLTFNASDPEATSSRSTAFRTRVPTPNRPSSVSSA